MPTYLDKSLSEQDIRDRFITPALEQAGWDAEHRRAEYSFTAGAIVVNGTLKHRKKGKRADYILVTKENYPIAVVEAKDYNHTASDGIQQAMDYAEILDIPFAYSTNGAEFVERDVDKAEDELIEALKLQPDNLQAVIMMGNLQGLGRRDKEVAKQYYDKALKLDPGNIIALNNIGSYYMGKRQFDTAIKYFKTGIKADPTFANGYYGIALCQGSLKEYQKAFDTCIEGLKKGKPVPENPAVFGEMPRLLTLGALQVMKQAERMTSSAM